MEVHDKINFKSVLENLEQLSKEYYDLHCPVVQQIEGAPSPLSFLRKCVTKNFPVIFRNAVNHWAALKNWNHDYLRAKLHNKKISVAVTPNGYADAVVNNMFVMPEEKQMTFDEFLNTLINPKSAVYYIQKQNDNLFTEFSELLDDVDPHIPWATEALGMKPDAVNFWMGDGRAITSMHKDNYENIYCVIKGKKDFILHPPIDALWIPYRSYQAGVYCNADKGFHISALENKVRWIPVDPLNPDFQQFPLYANAHQFHVTVREGDALYIPSLWFHHVRQSHGCIAVNYWYDMDIGANYCHFNFLQKMNNLLEDTTP